MQNMPYCTVHRLLHYITLASFLEIPSRFRVGENGLKYDILYPTVCTAAYTHYTVHLYYASQHLLGYIALFYSIVDNNQLGLSSYSVAFEVTFTVILTCIISLLHSYSGPSMIFIPKS